MSFVSNRFTPAAEDWHITLNRPHLPVQAHHNNFSLILSNFFGECEEIERKLYSIALTSLQWVWALPVGPNCLLTSFNRHALDTN